VHDGSPSYSQSGLRVDGPPYAVKGEQRHALWQGTARASLSCCVKLGGRMLTIRRHRPPTFFHRAAIRRATTPTPTVSRLNSMTLSPQCVYGSGMRLQWQACTQLLELWNVIDLICRDKDGSQFSARHSSSLSRSFNPLPSTFNIAVRVRLSVS
jgi:hypothetical protein